MAVYWNLAVFFNFLVDFLLIMGTNRLTGESLMPGRAALGAGIGALYAGGCLLPGFRFLGNPFWKTVSLGVVCLIAFGSGGQAVRRSAIFALMSMALAGIAGLDGGEHWMLICAAVGVLGLSIMGFREKGGTVSVELRYGEKTLRILGLRDTGNTLRDPLTGQQVLVAGADVAAELLGITRQELYHPVETLGAGRLPGLRLIPYRAVGTSGGLMLAIRIPFIKIGTRQGSGIVAFAPEGLDGNGNYQILTGGTV